MISVDEGVGVAVEVLCGGVDESGGGGGGGEEGEGGVVGVGGGALFVVRGEIWFEEVEILLVLPPGDIVVVYDVVALRERGGKG